MKEGSLRWTDEGDVDGEDVERLLLLLEAEGEEAGKTLDENAIKGSKVIVLDKDRQVLSSRFLLKQVLQ